MPKRTCFPIAASVAGVLLALGAGALMAPPVTAQSITADGIVKSKSDGLKFPDGTIQTTAAVAEDPCPTLDPSDEMIEVGGICVDKYEASLWDEAVGGNQITGEIPCSTNGQDCAGVIFARSVADVLPRADITWFQAQQALANSGKRLPTNAEWQMAVAGTPDDTGEETTPCNTRSFVVEKTGASPGCVSHWGAFDMVGNLGEWVAEWLARATVCPGWGEFSDDFMCMSGAAEGSGPGAFPRSGVLSFGEAAGPFLIWANSPQNWEPFIGFRGARRAE